MPKENCTARLSELQEATGQHWITKVKAAAFAGKTGPTAEKKLREFIFSWNAANPEKPILQLRGVVELNSLAHAMKESAKPKEQRAPRKTQRKAARDKALAALSAK